MTRWMLLLSFVCFGCGDDDAFMVDAGADAPRFRDVGTRDAGPARCTRDLDCDDGVACNGTEVCEPGLGADEIGCMEGTPLDCGEDECSEDLGRCPTECDLRGDQDGDSAISMTCGGADCDDMDPLRSPLLSEACDAVDNDCDERIDEGVSFTYYRDSDSDGFGDAADALAACTRPDGYVENMTDCDDALPSVNPSSLERCDGGTDEDCDGAVDEGCECTDGESRGCEQPGVCAAGTTMCVGGAFSPCSISPTPESCNGMDDDCDGSTDEIGC